MSAEQPSLDKAFPENQTRRAQNPGAEEWVGRKIEVLDKGFVYLVDFMGSDQAIEQAARVSYGMGTRSVSATEGLIRYLMRHRHTSPFEMAEMKFHAKMPISVARQWVRHRTANVNEYSARYSILQDEFYIPEHSEVSSQSVLNRQGRGESVNFDYAEEVRKKMEQSARNDYEFYSYLLNDDGGGNQADIERPMLARELARNVLPVSVYTEWYWKIDLHNLLHFLSLRMDEHAQWEIRQYADAISEITRDAFPMTWKAFEDFRLNSISIHGPEKETLVKIFASGGISFSEEEIREIAISKGLVNKGELKEFTEKLASLGLIK